MIGDESFTVEDGNGTYEDGVVDKRDGIEATGSFVVAVDTHCLQASDRDWNKVLNERVDFERESSYGEDVVDDGTDIGEKAAGSVRPRRHHIQVVLLFVLRRRCYTIIPSLRIQSRTSSDRHWNRLDTGPVSLGTSVLKLYRPPT